MKESRRDSHSVIARPLLHVCLAAAALFRSPEEIITTGGVKMSQDTLDCPDTFFGETSDARMRVNCQGRRDETRRDEMTVSSARMQKRDAPILILFRRLSRPERGQM